MCTSPGLLITRNVEEEDCKQCTSKEFEMMKAEKNRFGNIL